MGEAKSITGVLRPSDRELIMRAVTLVRPNNGVVSVDRWSLVRDKFAVGKTVAIALCEEFNLDPYETFGGINCEGCPFDDDGDE